MSAPPASRSRPAARRRPSRRRYLVRRLGALVVLGLIVFGVVRVVGAVVGDEEKVADANGADTVADRGVDRSADDVPGPAPDGTVAMGVDGAVTGAGTVDGTTDVTASVAGEPPTAQNPATVLIIGDSDAGAFGPYLQTLLDGTGLMRTTLDYKVSSGLSRPDWFDWPAHIDEVLPTVEPDIVVATFGGNDAQGIAVHSGEFILATPTAANEAEWTAEYQRRAGAVMDQLLAGGRTVVWVGIPNDDSPEVTARMAIQDRAAKAAAAERPDVIFIDTWKRFSGRDGNWAEYVIDPRDGEGKDVRASDGFHLNTTGAEILAIDIAQAIRDVLRAQGAAI